MGVDGFADGDHVPFQRESIRVDSSAAFYGKGVFTTIAIRDSQPLLWDKHLRRLFRDLAAVGLSGISELDATSQLTTFLHTNHIFNGRARMTIFDVAPSPIWHAGAKKQEIGLHIIAADDRPTPEAIRVGLSPFQVNSCSPLAGVKSCNYLENIIAIEAARGAGFDEAIRRNHRGEITGGCMSNVFWLQDDVLFTPSLKTGCLSGTTREYVMENIDCREVEAGMEELQLADAIFLTSAGLGIVEVDDLEDKKLGRHGHPITGLWPPPRRHEKTRRSTIPS